MLKPEFSNYFLARLRLLSVNVGSGVLGSGRSVYLAGSAEPCNPLQAVCEGTFCRLRALYKDIIDTLKNPRLRLLCIVPEVDLSSSGHVEALRFVLPLPSYGSSSSMMLVQVGWTGRLRSHKTAPIFPLFELPVSTKTLAPIPETNDAATVGGINSTN